MRFLKLLMWVLILVAFILFSIRNWTPISINLWGGLVMDSVLPVALLVAFFIGLLPTFLLHRFSRWSLSRKLDDANRSIDQLRTPAPVPMPPAQPTGAL